LTPAPGAEIVNESDYVAEFISKQWRALITHPGETLLAVAIILIPITIGMTAAGVVIGQIGLIIPGSIYLGLTVLVAIAAALDVS